MKLLSPAEPTHTVAWGETLATIAHDYYGDINMAAVIYQINRLTIPNPNNLQPYQTLIMPYPEPLR